MRLGSGVAIALAALVAGCAPNYVTDSSASVLFLMSAVNDGKVIDVDVRLSNGTICPDYASIVLQVQLKNPGATGANTNLNTVVVNQYQVQYTRSDGRGVPGLDVPYPVAGALTASVVPGADLTLPIEVVRRQAKLEPPLSNITGVQIVTMFGHITVYGTTVSGQAVTASGTVQLDFADYGDTASACPTAQ